MSIFFKLHSCAYSISFELLPRTLVSKFDLNYTQVQSCNKISNRQTGNIFGTRVYIYFTVAHFAANNDLIPNVIS